MARSDRRGEPRALPTLVDLSQEWSMDTPAFPTDESQVIRWAKRTATHGINQLRIETGMHVGTHIESPLHWTDGGRDIGSIPLERLYGPAVVADISDLASDYSIITPEMIEARADVQEGDILILHTGYNRFYSSGESPDQITYFFRHPGGHDELAEWIVERRVRWVGMDMASPEHAMNTNLRKLRPDLIDEAESALGVSVSEKFPRSGFAIMHIHLFKHDIPIVENLSGAIKSLIGKRVEVCAFPWRFSGGEAAMVRAVAFLWE